MVKNIMEDAVQEILTDILKTYTNICKCNKCIDDIKALALNNLKPFYASSEKGKVILKANKFNQQFNTDVANELVKAISVVTKNPVHCECKR